MHLYKYLEIPKYLKGCISITVDSQFKRYLAV